jgi:hypothetical protein
MAALPGEIKPGARLVDGWERGMILAISTRSARDLRIR